MALVRDAPAKAALLLILVVVLTVLTQIGGLVLWFCIPVFTWTGRRFDRLKPVLRIVLGLAMFVGAYVATSLAAVPAAGLFGRVPLSCGWIGNDTVAPRTLLTCLANRHYTRPPAQQALERINNRLSAENQDFSIVYLDAGFPFFDEFPMLPHLSHSDGRKVDLALIYEGGTPSPSPIGYWSYVPSRPGDPRPCAGREGWLRWNFDWLQSILRQSRPDDPALRELLLQLAAAPETRRILIEPHLKARLGVDSPKIRFRGCQAARHDDHIHVEF